MSTITEISDKHAVGPHLPPGFNDTFLSRFIDTGDIRLHAVLGGDGPPLLLIHGWPETWYAWRLVLAEAPRSANVDDQPSRGGEDRYVGHAFAEATVKTLPAYAIRHYVDTIAVNAAGVRGSFGFYRELDTTLAQNQRRAAHPPTLPILAVGGAASGYGSVAGALHLAGDDVHSLVIAGAGHYLAEEAPAATELNRAPCGHSIS